MTVVSYNNIFVLGMTSSIVIIKNIYPPRVSYFIICFSEMMLIFHRLDGEDEEIPIQLKDKGGCKLPGSKCYPFLESQGTRKTNCINGRVDHTST